MKNEQEENKIEESQEQAPEENNAASAQDELSAVQDQLARLTADFQNYKKRMEKDRVLWIDRSRSEVLLGLLDVVDNFDRALEDADKADEQEAFKTWMDGFQLIRKTLHDYLVAQKVSPIEQMQTFDPNLHEAVAQVEASDYSSGDVVEVMQKGYMYKESVLRTAKVTVAK